jgi:hypothetical protein
VKFFDRLWVVDSVDSVATATWHQPAAASQLRTQYLSALSHLQTWTTIQWKPDGLAITFDNPGAAADFIQREAWDAGRPVPDRLFPPHRQAGLYDLISSGLDYIAAVNRDLRELIELTIGEIFLAQEAGSEGGTMSSAVGLIWLNPRADWGPRKAGENIVPGRYGQPAFRGRLHWLEPGIGSCDQCDPAPQAPVRSLLPLCRGCRRASILPYHFGCAAES